MASSDWDDEVLAKSPSMILLLGVLIPFIAGLVLSIIGVGLVWLLLRNTALAKRALMAAGGGVVVSLMVVMGFAYSALGGDGGGMDARAYLEALDGRLSQADDESEALFSDPEFVRVASGSGPLSDEDREIARNALESVSATFDSFLADVEDFDPPEELQEEHDELVAAYRELDQQFSDIVLSQVDDAETIDDINQAFDELTTAAGERTSAACLAMQAEAEVNDVDVDLNC